MFINGPVDPPLTRAHEDPARAPVEWAAIAFGMFFLAIGFAGFAPGMTWNYNNMEMSYGSEAMVLGIFQVSVLHNVVHLIYGAAGIAQSRFSHSARRYLRIGGGLAAVLWIFGLLVNRDSPSNFLPMNTADDRAYFVLALAMIGLSFLSSDITPKKVKSDRRP